MKHTVKPAHGRTRVVIEAVHPVVDAGAYPAKAELGEWLILSADLLADGHDVIRARVKYREAGTKKWNEIPMRLLNNDRWEAKIKPENIGVFQFSIEAWIDRGMTWHHDTLKKFEAKQDISVELQSGVLILEEIVKGLKGNQAKSGRMFLNQLSAHDDESGALLMNAGFVDFLEQHPLRLFSATSAVYDILVEPHDAEFTAWYEFFPRSTASRPGQHGNFKDCERVLDFVSNLGFDTVYLPPIHPIGDSFRKGKNNALPCKEGEPGSPWAIGNKEGGHKAIHPALGNEDDFQSLVRKASSLGIRIALDYALQCSPEHPYVKEHPQWFKWRPDGTVQYAENPPKKYQDVLPFDFECEDWKNLWDELRSIIIHWVKLGVTVFRVDNPHTKPFSFWEWLIASVKAEYPEVIFLSEAFTRPKIMNRLAKLGFTQSYTYFTWRTNKDEIIAYIEELTKGESAKFFRPNFWPNTPDILPYDLQNTGSEHHAVRFVLAATLSASYGMYGPVYDLAVSAPYPNKEEYLDSEKYEIRHWDWESMTPLRKLIQAVNRIRKSEKALQYTHQIQFCTTDNPMLIAYLKQSPDGDHRILCIVNLDPVHAQSGFVTLPEQLIPAAGSWLTVTDLLNGESYHWDKASNYVRLDPASFPAHILRC